MDTRKWTDGVLTFAARQMVKEPSDVSSWMVCDGDIDPVIDLSLPYLALFSVRVQTS